MKRITYPTACVLQALANGKGFGLQIVEHTGLPSGTVYPILRKLERSRLVRSKWETPAEASGNRRPRRRNYELTALGKKALVAAAERYLQHRKVFDASVP